MAQFIYQIYIFIIEAASGSTPPQDLIDLLETGWTILSATSYGTENRAVFFILKKLK